MNSNFNFSKDYNSEGELDLIDLLKIFKRRWYIIFIFIFSSILFSVPYSLTRPKVWAGNFKIVIENQSGKGDTGATSLLSRLGSANDLTTEVIILESPLILKPVFDYVIKSDQDKGIDTKGLTYDKWFKNKLNINLKRK